MLPVLFIAFIADIVGVVVIVAVVCVVVVWYWLHRVCGFNYDNCTVRGVGVVYTSLSITLGMKEVGIARECER